LRPRLTPDLPLTAWFASTSSATRRHDKAVTARTGQMSESWSSSTSQQPPAWTSPPRGGSSPKATADACCSGRRRAGPSCAPGSRSTEHHPDRTPVTLAHTARLVPREYRRRRQSLHQTQHDSPLMSGRSLPITKGGRLGVQRHEGVSEDYRLRWPSRFECALQGCYGPQ